MKVILRSAVAAGLLACSSPAAQRPELATVRDSAGIELVEHPAGSEARLPQWIVADSPLVDLGGRNDEPGHDLHLVSGALLLSDGRIVVANRGSNELRVFDSTGRYLSAIGRQGRGPGEFSTIGSLQLLPGDSIFVVDPQLRRGTLFGADGTLARTIASLVRPLGPERRGYIMATGALSNGRFLGTSNAFSEMKETSGPVRRDLFAVVSLNPDSAIVDTVALVPGWENYPALGYEGGHSFPTLRTVEFGRVTVFATDGERVYVGTNETDELRVYRPDGRLLRLIRGVLSAEPVTQEHRDRRMQETLDGYARSQVSEQIKAEWRKNLEDSRYAETFPLYERLIPGADRSLWVELPRHYNDEGRRLVVFDSTGYAVATVTAPERMRPYVVGPDRVIGLWRDADDAHHVRVYPVRKPGDREGGK